MRSNKCKIKNENDVSAPKHWLINGLGMDAHGGVGSMDAIMDWAWMHWPMDGLAAWTWLDADLSDRESEANEVSESQPLNPKPL